MRLLRILVLLLPVCLALPAAAGDDKHEEQAARAFAREELLREARSSVEGGGPGLAALAAMRRSLEEDVRFADQVDDEAPVSRDLLEAFRKTIAERLLLLGVATPGKAVGAVLEASRLEDWLLGLESSTVRVQTSAAGDEAGHPYTYPPLPPVRVPPVGVPPAASAQETRGTEPEPAVPAAETASGTVPKAVAGSAPAGGPTGAATTSPASPEDGAAHSEDAAHGPPAVGVGESTEDEPWEPPSVATWAREVVRAGEGGSLLERVFLLEGHPSIDELLTSSRSAPAFVHPEIRRLHRHALLTGDVFPYNAALTALRSLQADEHNKALQADQPQSALIDGGMVREKAEIVARYQELITRHSERSEAITAQLDAMVLDLDAWKTQAALLAGEIEERRRTLLDQGNEADLQGDLTMRLAQARETCATLDIMLLYLTANRGRVRLSLLKALLRAANEEATAAESVHTRYERALQSLRRARRLDRLSSDNRKIRLWITAATAQPAEEGSRASLRLTAYKALLEVNEGVRDAVRRRGLMTASGGTRGTTEPVVTGQVDDPIQESGGRRLSAMVRAPQKANWDAKFVELARRELHDPEFRSVFDADLVAAHYAAVDERILRLVQAYDVSRDEGGLNARYEDGLAKAEAALRPLVRDRLANARRLPSMLTASQEDFVAAMTGIAERREKNQARLRVLVAYRGELRDLGTRSLLIRVDRNLMDAHLGNAMRGTRAALDSAGRWVSFQGDSHAGGFLRESWSRLLLVIAVLGLALLLVRVGRSVVDRWIERKVASYPEYGRMSASVREERTQGRAARNAADLAVAQTSIDEVLNQVREDSGSPEDSAAPEDSVVLKDSAPCKAAQAPKDTGAGSRDGGAS